MRNYTDMMNNLDSFVDLEKGWNGHGADPIPDRVIEKARDILSLDIFKKHIPFVCPVARDSIQIEWEKKDKDYFEFEIFIDKVNGMRMFPDESHINYEEISITKMLELIKGFFGDSEE